MITKRLINVNQYVGKATQRINQIERKELDFISIFVHISEEGLTAEYEPKTTACKISHC